MSAETGAGLPMAWAVVAGVTFTALFTASVLWLAFMGNEKPPPDAYD